MVNVIVFLLFLMVHCYYVEVEHIFYLSFQWEYSPMCKKINWKPEFTFKTSSFQNA